MQRVSLKEQFHGEPNPNQEGLDAVEDGYDQVTLKVVGGSVVYLVPNDVPDDRAVQRQFIERFVRCQMQLENGAELTLWINAGAHGVDLHLQPPSRKKPNRNGARAKEEWR